MSCVGFAAAGIVPRRARRHTNRNRRSFVAFFTARGTICHSRVAAMTGDFLLFSLGELSRRRCNPRSLEVSVTAPTSNGDPVVAKFERDAVANNFRVHRMNAISDTILADNRRLTVQAYLQATSILAAGRASGRSRQR